MRLRHGAAKVSELEPEGHRAVAWSRRIKRCRNCPHPTVKRSTTSTYIAPATMTLRLTHAGGPPDSAERRVCRRAHTARPSQPRRRTTADSIILPRQASARGEGTMSMTENPNTPTKLATAQTDAVRKIAFIVRRLTVWLGQSGLHKDKLKGQTHSSVGFGWVAPVGRTESEETAPRDSTVGSRRFLFAPEGRLWKGKAGENTHRAPPLHAAGRPRRQLC